MKGEVKKLGKNRYRIRFSLPRDPVTGKRHRPTKTIHGTRKHAETILREWIRDYELGKWTPGKSLTLNQHIDEWASAAASNLEERTLKAYLYDLERFVRNTIGRMPIEKIRPLDIQNLFIALVDGGTGPSSVKRLRASLSNTFGQALRWQRVNQNPVLGTQIPQMDKIIRRPPNPMTPEQANRFLEAASQTQYYALFELALSSGMRPAEYLGLGWNCVDWNGERVTVERAVKRPRKTKPKLGPPKNKQSRRSITIPPEVMESLHHHKIEQNQERLRLGERWRGDLDLVFPTATGGIWDEANFKAQAFDYVTQLAGLKGFRPYDLRHTCATLLLKENVHAKIVSERLGHSSITRTLDVYSHVFPTMQNVASDTLKTLLFGGIKSSF